MKNLFNKFDWNNFEKTIGGMKFAVVIILIFALAMTVGTFLESYYGTDFVNRTVYKTTWFMLIQFFMLLSIVFAAFLRLPPKKRLYGFYTIHSGLVIIGIGSIITYVAGIDGMLNLAPNEPNRQVILSKDVLKFTYPEEGKQVTRELPYKAFPVSLNQQYDSINVLEFIPFAEGSFQWAKAINDYPPSTPTHSSRYFFENPFASQELTLTIHPEASTDFQASTQMGPLSFNYMPENLANCFNIQNPSGIIVWDVESANCFTPEDKGIPVKETTAKNRFIAFPYNDKLLTFFPDLSPFPVDNDFVADQKSDLRVFSKKLFEDKPSLFLFGKRLSYYSKEDKKWLVKDIEVKGKPVDLPWMSATITLLDHQEKMVPFNVPTPIIPIQKNGMLIKGDVRAVKFNIHGKEYWATNYNPLSLIIGGKKVIAEVTKETLILPFELALTQFKMDKDPGTNNPASYESFVKLFSDGNMTNHHIFMNNPLKHRGFTFYQASYSQDSAGNYHSSLSVNVDQGRFLKYLGSLMLVLGGIWHYVLNVKKKKGEK